ncbi:MAG: GTP 3',8-cyclase MoaA [Microthrixaceae bacterium]
MSATPLLDRYGRVHRDLRLSVTDRCNLRCTYCMPAEGLNWLPRSEVLTFEETERVVRLLVERFGIGSVRLTGGEPSLRSHLDDLISRLARLGDGVLDLALTTNGLSLVRDAARWRDAGLGRLNVSLDTLRVDRFRSISRRDGLDRVVAGIERAVAVGFETVKINSVVMAGVNDDEVVELAAFGRDLGVEVRFIEFMPVDADRRWDRAMVVDAAEILARIDARFPLAPTVDDPSGSAPARVHEYLDGRGRVGVIASVSEPFCGRCDRIRLTAEGALRNCLFSTEETDLRSLLRSGADDERIAEAVATCVGAKRRGHGTDSVQFVRSRRSMSQIGG